MNWETSIECIRLHSLFVCDRMMFCIQTLIFHIDLNIFPDTTRKHLASNSISLFYKMKQFQYYVQQQLMHIHVLD